MSQHISKTSYLLYALLAFPLAFAGLPIYVHAPDFYATEMGLSLSALGIVLLVLRLIDAAQDPFLGSLSDALSAHRKLVLCISAFMLSLGFTMLFNPIGSSLIWFAASVFICTTGFSLVTINFHTLGGLWDVSKDQRTVVSATREGFTLIGLLVASIIPNILMASMDKKDAFSYLGYAYLPLVALCFVIFLKWWKGANFQKSSDDQSTNKISFALMVKNKWNISFFGVYGLSNFASAIPATLVIFFIRDKLDAEHLTGLFLLLYFLSGAAFMPLWQIISKKTGKIQAWRWSMIAACITFVWAFFLSEGDVTSYGIICVFSGAALGADLALPPAILADRIDETSTQHGASKYYAALTFLTKFSFALATGFALPVLSFMGFEPGQALTPEASVTMSVIYALIPCIFKAICIVFLAKK